MTSPSDHRLRSVRASTQQRGVRRAWARSLPIDGSPYRGKMASSATHGAAPRAAVVSRPRLLDRLQRRFEVRLLTITGGGGSGKTTLLAQAMEAESDHVDVWYPCGMSDRSGDRLLGGVLAACAAELGAEVEADDVDPLDRLNELVLGASPRQVCLVVDDVHVLGKSEALEQLIDALPANGHLLASGRATPAFSTARLDAAGQLEEIRQDELLLTDDEVIQFANLRGVDVANLAAAEGWPAFVELATAGTEARSRRYLDEEALAGLSLDRRRHLAAFSFVGGGDDEICRAVTGVSLEALVKDLPLVRWSGEHAQLHDLWGELLATELGDDDRSAAAVAAAAVVRRRRDIDRAIDLASEVEAWDDVVTSLSAAVQHGVGGGLSAQQLRRWRSILPAAIADSPIGLLIDGLLERERDQTSSAAIALLDQAARAFELEGNHQLELVALTQLGYLARIGGEPRDVELFNERVARLATDHPPALPFLAIGEAWTALTTGRPDRQLAALQSIDGDALPPIWQITRRHLMAHALFNLGRADEALAVVPKEIDTLPVPIPGALVTESQCTWYAGYPERALADPPSGSSARHGARDRFIAGAWRSLMNIFAGDVDQARQALAEAQSFAGQAPGALVQSQVAGLDLLLHLAEGDEGYTADGLRGILELFPLGDGVSELLFNNVFAVPYVLVPASRAYWDRAPLSGIHATVRSVAAAFARVRDSDDLSLITTMTWPEPGLIAAHMPVRWCAELALHGVRANRHEARRLAAWLVEHWQQPARAALQEFADDTTLGDAARDVLTHTPTPPATSPALRLLGHTEVTFDEHHTSDPNWRRERVRALLCWLALNPDTSRDRAGGALVARPLDRTGRQEPAHHAELPARRAGARPLTARRGVVRAQRRAADHPARFARRRSLAVS